MFDATDITDMMDAIGTVSAAISLHGVPVRTVSGIFRRRLASGVPFEYQEPARHVLQLRCLSPDLDDLTPSHRMTIAGVDYRVVGVPVPYNTGMSTVELVEA